MKRTVLEANGGASSSVPACDHNEALRLPAIYINVFLIQRVGKSIALLQSNKMINELIMAA